MKEKNCHEQSEPDCLEDAYDNYNEQVAICDALDDMSWDKPQCYKDAEEELELNK